MQIACNRQVMKRKIWLHGAKRIADYCRATRNQIHQSNQP